MAAGEAAATPEALLLFDIDGTLLIGAHAVHRDAVHAALREVHGIADPAAASVIAAGRTDGEIARAIALQHGISAERIDEGAEAVRDATCRIYAETCPDDLSGHLSPFVPELLDRLAARDDVRLSLLTGNFEPVARLKLARAGIGHHFPVGAGAFGSDDEDRTRLPAIARRRTAVAGEPFPRERTYVIGDTPNDIACARADAVHAIAIATGAFSPDELRGADAVARDPGELAGVLDELLA